MLCEKLTLAFSSLLPHSVKRELSDGRRKNDTDRYMDRKQVTVWNGKTTRTPERVRRIVGEYHDSAQELAAWLFKTFRGDRPVNLENRLSPSSCKLRGHVLLFPALFELFQKTIVRREAIAVWHDNVVDAVCEELITSSGDLDYYDDNRRPSLEESNNTHKHFTSELTRKRAVFEAYVERLEMETKEDRSSTSAHGLDDSPKVVATVSKTNGSEMK